MKAFWEIKDLMKFSRKNVGVAFDVAKNSGEFAELDLKILNCIYVREVLERDLSKAKARCDIKQIKNIENALQENRLVYSYLVILKREKRKEFRKITRMAREY